MGGSAALSTRVYEWFVILAYASSYLLKNCIINESHINCNDSSCEHVNVLLLQSQSCWVLVEFFIVSVLGTKPFSRL